MYSLTNRSSNTLPFLHMPNQDYARIVGIPIPTLVDTPPRTPTSSTRTCSFAGPLSSHPVSPIDFSLPSTPIDGPPPAFYRQSSPLSAHRLERRLERERPQSRLSERAPPVPQKDSPPSIHQRQQQQQQQQQQHQQRYYATAGLGLSTRTDDFVRSQMSTTTHRHTMMESPTTNTFNFDLATPNPHVIHTYITPPSSTSPPTRPSFASRLFGRSFRTSSSTSTSKHRSMTDSAVQVLPDTPETSSSSASPRSPASEFPPMQTQTQAKHRISSPMPLQQQHPNVQSTSKRDSTSSKHTIRATSTEAVPRLRRKKSVGNWLDAAKRKSGLWWGENAADDVIADKENQVVPVRHDVDMRRSDTTSSRGSGSSWSGHDAVTLVDTVAPKLPELRQMGLRINGGRTGLVKVIGDIGR